MYTADRHAGAMHGKQFLLDAIYAGVDQEFLYGRLDFAGEVPQGPVFVSVDIDVANPGVPKNAEPLRLQLKAEVAGELRNWTLRNGHDRSAVHHPGDGRVILVPRRRSLEFQLPLEMVGIEREGNIGLRFSLWTDGLPLDALPVEGALHLQAVKEEEDLKGNIYR